MVLLLCSSDFDIASVKIVQDEDKGAEDDDKEEGTGTRDSPLPGEPWARTRIGQPASSINPHRPEDGQTPNIESNGKPVRAKIEVQDSYTPGSTSAR